MKYSSLKNFIAIPIIFVFSLIAVNQVFYTQNANAFFGRSKCPNYSKTGGYEGYFEGKCVKSSGNSDAIKGGISSSIDSVKKLISFLKDANKNGSKQNKTGSGFIVHTMLGHDGDDSGVKRKISSDDWDELEKRLKGLEAAGKINWSKKMDTCRMTTYYQSTEDDDAFYNRQEKYGYDCDEHKTIKFYNYDGDFIYALDRVCANPIGNKDDFDELPEVKEWYISAKSYVDKINGAVAGQSKSKALPGQQIDWVNKVYNDGPDRTTESIYSNVVLSGGFSYGWDGTRAGGSVGDDKRKGEIRNITDYSDYWVSQADVGKNLCQQVQFDPKNWEGDRNGKGNKVCVYIAYNYDLKPSISDDQSDVIEPGTTIKLYPDVDNVIPTYPTRSENIEWRITEVRYDSGNPIPTDLLNNSTYSNTTPCPTGSYFNPNNGCRLIKSGTTQFKENGDYLSGTNLLATASIGDYPSGTKICYAFSIRPNSNKFINNNNVKDNRWRHSRLSCVVIGKKPKVQVWGGDTVTAKAVQTSTTYKSVGAANGTFGSWTEYGIMASSSITGMASGSAFVTMPKSGVLTGFEPGNPNPTVINYSKLSLSNSNSPTLGSYTSISKTLPDLLATYPGGNILKDTTFAPNSLTSSTGTMIYDAGAKNLNVTASTLSKSKTIIIKTTGQITISGNQRYNNGPYKSIDQIPQLILIGKRIVIASDVTNVDAWLVASDYVTTCDYGNDTTTALTNATCEKQLTVNGPVITNKLYLRRTYGSENGTKSNDPAEIFNLRADAYLWSASQASDHSQVYSARTFELPPRF